MFKQTLITASRLQKHVRFFRTNNILREAKATTGEKPVVCPTPDKKVDPETVLGAKYHKCSNFDKWLLAWLKKYPNSKEVPDKVPIEVLQRAHGQARIRLANFMMLFTLMGCLWAVVTGKSERAAGNTMLKQNLDWHADLNKEHSKTQEVKSS